MTKNKIFLTGIGLLCTLLLGYFVLNSILFNGIKPVKINEHGFLAEFYLPKVDSNKKAVILLGGGVWGNYWGAQFAKNGFVGLSLPYSGIEGLPKLPG